MAGSFGLSAEKFSEWHLAASVRRPYYQWSDSQCGASSFQGKPPHENSEQLPCRVAAEVRIFSPSPFFSAKGVVKFGMKFSVLRFPRFGCSKRKDTLKIHAKNGVNNGEFHANFTLLGHGAERSYCRGGIARFFSLFSCGIAQVSLRYPSSAGVSHLKCACRGYRWGSLAVAHRTGSLPWSSIPWCFGFPWCFFDSGCILGCILGIRGVLHSVWGAGDRNAGAHRWHEVMSVCPRTLGRTQVLVRGERRKTIDLFQGQKRYPKELLRQRFRRTFGWTFWCDLLRNPCFNGYPRHQPGLIRLPSLN